jgi:hypothetical protein
LVKVGWLAYILEAVGRIIATPWKGAGIGMGSPSTGGDNDPVLSLQIWQIVGPENHIS